MPGSVPKAARLILKGIRSNVEHESLYGDLEEYYHNLHEKKGWFSARKWYWSQVFTSAPSLVSSSIKWSLVMLGNYIKIAFRNLTRQKGYSFINILGLAVGMAAFILIMLWVNFELSYDKFHEKADRTFRFHVHALIGSTEINQTGTSNPMSIQLAKDFPQIEHIMKMDDWTNMLVTVDDKSFASTALIVDSTFFDVFSFTLLNGTQENVLNKPNLVVLTESAAKRYFGNQDPINKSFNFNGMMDVTVSGIMQDFPPNSHFRGDFLLSLLSDPSIQGAGWTTNNYSTYITLHEGVTKEEMEALFPEFTRQNMSGGNLERFDQWIANGNFWNLYLQPLTSIHLHSHLNGEFEQNGNAAYVYIFAVVAVFILLIACVNFMNLTTARSSKRAREVGMRKVVGSTRQQLMRQFIAESMLASFIALGFAILLIEIALPAFSNFTGKILDLNYFGNLSILPMLIAVAVIVGLISGTYPAFILSSFKPVSILKGSGAQKSGSSILRNILVVLQFATSIALIAGTLIVGAQLDYFQNKQLGFNKEQVLVINSPGQYGRDSVQFKEALKKHSSVKYVAGANTLPGRSFSNIGFNAEEVGNITLNMCWAEYDYLNTLQLEMAEGRFFSEDFPTDSSAMIINESAARLLAYDDPIGKTISNGRNRLHVIGVVKDYHYESFHTKIRPMALVKLGGTWTRRERLVTIRFESENVKDVVNYAQQMWDEHVGNIEMQYTFFDEEYSRIYRNEMQTGKIFSTFSMLAILIASLGLFGLASYTAEQRTKEIGVRKVLGASETNIVVLLSKEFAKWVLTANIIAWPAAWFVMNLWLENFVYRTDINIMVFIYASIIALVIAMLTVSGQALRAALTNPAKALKYE